MTTLERLTAALADCDRAERRPGPLLSPPRLKLLSRNSYPDCKPAEQAGRLGHACSGHHRVVGGVDGFAGDFFTGDFVAVFGVGRVAATVVDVRAGVFAAVPADAFDFAGAFAFALGVGIASAVRSKSR